MCKILFLLVFNVSLTNSHGVFRTLRPKIIDRMTHTVRLLALGRANNMTDADKAFEIAEQRIARPLNAYNDPEKPAHAPVTGPSASYRCGTDPWLTLRVNITAPGLPRDQATVLRRQPRKPNSAAHAQRPCLAACSCRGDGGQVQDYSKAHEEDLCRVLGRSGRSPSRTVGACDQHGPRPPAPRRTHC